MSASRREFLSRATRAAAFAGLGPAALALTARAAQARPHLDAALRCARWIEQSAIRSGDAVSWPADPLRPGSVGYDHYNGMAGVVTFLAALHDAGGDPRWLELARGGARTLRARLDGPPASHNDGLYTGLAGQAYALLMLERAGGGAEWGAAARRATDLIVSRAKRLDGGVEWSSSWDIVSGIAGTGLFLLYAAALWRDAALVETARLAGERLLATGTAAEGGTMWFPGAGVTRNYPNFSHGTSGVAYFLATLGQVTGVRRFTDAALSGARYLDAIASRTGDAIAIFHVTGGGENRYYLSWCHGPAGTARLFYRLHTLTGGTHWLAWVDGLTRTIARSGIPEERTDGYWNNVSQCCGNAGVGQYCIDLARHHPSAASRTLVDRIVSNTMARATSDGDGLKWIQAENRTQPENLVAQTGFMQGAAGIGTFFLQLDALARGRPWRFAMPDTPFAERP